MHHCLYWLTAQQQNFYLCDQQDGALDFSLISKLCQFAAYFVVFKLTTKITCLSSVESKPHKVKFMDKSGSKECVSSNGLTGFHLKSLACQFPEEACRHHTSLLLDVFHSFPREPGSLVRVFFFFIREPRLRQIPFSHSQTCQHGAPPGSAKPLACFQRARIEYINKATYS